MKGDEIVLQVNARRTADTHFISWWRREEDWLDIELIDAFLQNVQPDQEIGGFTLLGLDEMWEHVRKVAGSRVKREKKGGVDDVTWTRPSGRVLACPMTPENLMRIFDVETRGNFVDG